MEPPKREDAILLLDSVLKKHGSKRPQVIYKEILDVFRGNKPPLFSDFSEGYNPGIPADELFDILYPEPSPSPPANPYPPRTENVKHGKRHNPLEVRRPSVKKSNWREKYNDPTLVFTNLGSRGDVALCDSMDEEARRKFEVSGNILFVLEAFFQRVDFLCGGLTQEQVSEAKTEEYEYVLHDGGGLYLLVAPDGLKKWYIGEEPIGNFPDCSLSYVRRYYLTQRDLFAKGINFPDPHELKLEIEKRIDNCYEDEPHVPIPAWMAQALADGFKHYLSRRIHHRKDVTLDEVLGINGEKARQAFDIFSIDSSKLLEETREFQWYCNLAFATASRHALQKLKLEPDARGDGIDYDFTHAELDTLRANEARGVYGTYGAWYESKGYAYLAPISLREDFLELIEIIDPGLRRAVEKDMKDPRKRLFKNRP